MSVALPVDGAVGPEVATLTAVTPAGAKLLVRTPGQFLVWNFVIFRVFFLFLQRFFGKKKKKSRKGYLFLH